MDKNLGAVLHELLEPQRFEIRTPFRTINTGLTFAEIERAISALEESISEQLNLKF